MRKIRTDRRANGAAGQASVEFLAGIPLLAIVLLAGWQTVLAGHTWWQLREAARIAARESYVAQRRGDAVAGKVRGNAVAAALLKSSRSRSVQRLPDGAVRVSADLPLVAPLRAALGTGPTLSATSRFER